MIEKKALTTGDIAEYCGVNYRTVIRWIDKGHLKSYKLPGRGDNRVEVEHFLEFLQQNNIPVPSDLKPEKARILVVDDNKRVSNAYKRLLAQNGYEAIIVNDGFKAGICLTTSKPQLVLLDLHMPHIDGFDIIDFVKKNPDMKGVKICVISGGDQKDLEKAKKAGADFCIAKPFQKEVLIEQINKLLT